MGNRELLGAADVDDETLSGMVAALLREERVELLHAEVSPADYDLPAITTAGRHWVSGRAATTHGAMPFRLFVKQVRCWSRSPLFAYLPPDLRDWAAASVPWRTEALVYRSDLDELSAAVWLAEVPTYDRPWDLDRYRRAAHLLGRLAGSPAVAPLADVGGHAWTVRDYLEGRFRHQVEELLAAPHLPGHGDACPNNLLDEADPDGFVLIDFGFWKPLPFGFDLGQLLLGDVQLGRRSASTLAETDATIVPAYVEELAAEGLVIDPADVTRRHALHMVIFSGLSSMPFEHLDEPPTPELRAIAADRAALATYCLDLVDAT